MPEGINFGQMAKRKKIETFIEICKKKKQKQGKGKLETFGPQSLFKNGYPVDLAFCFELYQESYTPLKHRDLVVVCNFVRF